MATTMRGEDGEHFPTTVSVRGVYIPHHIEKQPAGRGITIETRVEGDQRLRIMLSHEEAQLLIADLAVRLVSHVERPSDEPSPLVPPPATKFDWSSQH